MATSHNKRPRILFISINRHQHRYFTALGASLGESYEIQHIHYINSPLSLLAGSQVPQQLTVTSEEVAALTRFQIRKAEYREFSGLRKIVNSRYVLTRQAYYALNYFYKVITANQIDLVCVWNGTLVPVAAAALVARKLGRKTLFFENGYLPNTTTVDPAGVNFNNSLQGKPRDFFDAVQVDGNKLAQLYEQQISIRKLKKKWYTDLLKREKPQHLPENVDLPKRYLFVPLQVHDDTQVIMHSRNIQNMFELVDAVVPAVASYNAMYDDNLWVVVKEHPSDNGRIDYTALCEKYQGQKVIFLKYYPTPQLIDHAAGILTINSSVGIEGLLKHKSIITLGDAFYNVDGLVHHVKELAELPRAINAINLPFDHVLADKFLYFLRYKYLAEGSWRQPDSRHFQSAYEKIAQTLQDFGDC